MENKDLLNRAWNNYNNSDYESALEDYLSLRIKSNTSLFDTNISIIKNKINSRIILMPMGEALKKIGVDAVYVVNLDRRPDRKIKILLEFNRHNIKPIFISGEDALYSDSVERYFNKYKNSPPGTVKFSNHMNNEVQRSVKKNITKGAFGYNLSQKKVFLNAKQKKYTKIAVFDDDCFFTNTASEQLISLNNNLPDWKIVLLGASEYSDANFIKENILNKSNYHPNPGNTCGSFGMLYDSSVYDEMLDAIEACDGTFDNNILGYFYHKFPKGCHVVNPNICIPSVEDSNIRHANRQQVPHSKKMRWNLDNFKEWKKPIEISIIISDIENIMHAESLKNIHNDINVRLYYVSKFDGIRTIIPGRGNLGDEFISDDINSLFLSQNTENKKSQLKEMGLPISDYCIFWPTDLEITMGSIRDSVCSELLGLIKDGQVSIHKGFGKKITKGLSSIIIPSYRHPSQSLASIQSALNQIGANVEIVVINDNPTNKNFTQELNSLIKTKIGSSLKVINHHVNRRASAARNTGLFASSGEFVFFLDDDDIFYPERVSNATVAMKMNKEDDSLFCGYEGSWNGNKDDARFVSGDLLDDILKLNYTNHYMCTNTISYRREALESIGGFNESYIRHQDLELNARFFLRYTINSLNSFDVRNRPNAVDETFSPSLKALIDLKVKFINDFKGEILSYKDEDIKEIILKHAQDILKYTKPSPTEKELLINLLTATLG